MAYDIGCANIVATGRLMSPGRLDSSGTPGDATQNFYAGRAAMVSGTNTMTLTCNQCTANSLVFIQMETLSNGVDSLMPTPAAGSFTVKSLKTGVLTNVTAIAKFSFMVVDG